MLLSIARRVRRTLLADRVRLTGARGWQSVERAGLIVKVCIMKVYVRAL